eukprot:scaffold155632_cov45-Attheya_sp.AAC.2
MATFAQVESIQATVKSRLQYGYSSIHMKRSQQHSQQLAAHDYSPKGTSVSPSIVFIATSLLLVT